MRDSNIFNEVCSSDYRMDEGRSFFIVGGAGFIGSHFTERLLRDGHTRRVTVFDNFSSGREWHVQGCLGENDDRFHLIRGDARDLDALSNSMYTHDIVIHLASNPDIARAVKDPEIDFHHGT